MSFRNRLTLFFLVIVIVPMIAVTLVLYWLVSDSADEQANSAVTVAHDVAFAAYRREVASAMQAARTIGSAPKLGTAVASRNRVAIQRELVRLARAAGARRVRAELSGLGRFDVGRAPVVAPAASRLVDRRGRGVGRLQVSHAGAVEFAESSARDTGLELIVLEDDRVVASTIEGDIGPVGALQKSAEDIRIDGTDYKSSSFAKTGFGGTALRLHVLSDIANGGSPSSRTSLAVGGALIIFLLAAFAFALTVSRSLQAQVERLLAAARRLGRGDFDIQVPTEGNDEFAALGSEFNSMARQLEARLRELQQERARLQGAIRRVGESFAKGLDRDALLDIAVQTAVDGVGADFGRATVRDALGGQPVEVARAGDLAAHRDAIDAVETEVLLTGAAAETEAGGACALAQPLRASEGSEILGLISVARTSRPFADPDKELFSYLAGQAAVSLENVDLHETVQRQAVTDELTGLFNHRRFQEVMALEVERARRFGSDMGLVMLDIDDFKRINDTYGHIQGDMVLRQVAQVLRESAREIDEPARYGGEEMAVALPQTDLEGAHQFAERVRRRIEALELPVLGGNGTLRVTASFGAAATGGPGPVREADKAALVAAADAALYRAKRAGKNRTVRAG